MVVEMWFSELSADYLFHLILNVDASCDWKA